ncbi:MAG: type 4a pilus biogenesis protein PilO [Clostridia bacterium]|nr:type 4a pilus biogenesis protein PilO [Clostridia bacterium]
MEEIIGKVKNFSPREQKIISAAVLLLIFVLFYQFLWKNQWSRFNEISAQVENLENTIKHGSFREIKVMELKSELEYLQKKYRLISDKFISSSDKGAVLEIVDFFERYGVVSSFQPGEVVKRKGYNILPVSIVYEGSYESLLEALKKLESGKRIVDIKNIKMGYKDSGGSLVFTAELKMYLYQLIDKQPSALSKFNGEGVEMSWKRDAYPFRPKTKPSVQSQGEKEETEKRDLSSESKPSLSNNTSSTSNQSQEKQAEQKVSPNKHEGYNFPQNTKEKNHEGYSFPTS